VKRRRRWPAMTDLEPMAIVTIALMFLLLLLVVGIR